MRDYWDDRFQKEGKIWGYSPSSTVKQAIDLFKKDHVKTVLIPGAGYGRNAKAFSDAGFTVAGIEVSAEAISLAKEYVPMVRYYQGSVLGMPFSNDVYDSIYCFNVLHLFRKADRKVFVDKCLGQLKEGGSLYFVVFSEKEPSYGRGAEVEPGTFESKPGRPVHYFTEQELREQFHQTSILGSGIVEDPEDHGEEGPHTHVLRYFYAQKRR
jgi:SAM-dependent methyltransferase